ncbi:proline-rich protein HaeIII subfamily 1-like [Haemorhous mexicanus]|uniref:proline-rich protein HaeIII subfamily 1-like n=1 Tax=Haemorhous mexicanus TaxID=30427 RepID=UPI0028BF51FC|nr:proline-rich protein HaeIII subfamily 1-like [Haemorhous mexicanus]
MKSLLRPTQCKGKGNPSPAGCTTSSKPHQRDPASEHPTQPQTPPRPLASASRSPPGPRRPRCSPRRPRGLPGRPPPGGPPGQGRSSAEPGPWGGGGRRQSRDSGWQRCRAPPGGAGRGGVRCPRAERRGPAWRAGQERRGGAGQAAEPRLPEGLAGPLRSARQRRRPGASAEPPPLGAAPDGAPPPAPREPPPPASPVPGGRSPARH